MTLADSARCQQQGRSTAMSSKLNQVHELEPPPSPSAPTDGQCDATNDAARHSTGITYVDVPSVMKCERSTYRSRQTRVRDKDADESMSRLSRTSRSMRIPNSVRTRQPALSKALSLGTQMHDEMIPLNEIKAGLSAQVKESVRNIAATGSASQERSTAWRNRVTIYSSFAVAIVLATFMLIVTPSLENFFVDASPNAWAVQDEKTALELQLVKIQLLASQDSNSTQTDYPVSSPTTQRNDDETLVQRLDRNDAIAAFIGVTSLVFALIFASTYTDAQSRLNEIRNSLAQEAGGVHLAMLLVRTLDDTDPSDTYKTRALLLFASYIEHLAAEIKWQQGGGRKQYDPPTRSNVETLYAAIPFLAAVGSDGDGDEMDRVLVQRTVDTLNTACGARQIRVLQERRNISPYVYAFLGQMALMTYFGALFLHTGSYALNNAVCLATLVSMATSMMILADLDKPYKGFVQVDTNIFSAIRNDVSLVLHEDNEREEERASMRTHDGAATTSADTNHEQWNLAGSQVMASALSPYQSQQKAGNMLTASFRGIDSNYHLRQAVRRMSDGILATRSNSFRTELIDNGLVNTPTTKVEPPGGHNQSTSFERPNPDHLGRTGSRRLDGCGGTSILATGFARPGTPGSLLFQNEPARTRPQSRGNVVAVSGNNSSTSSTKYAVESVSPTSSKLQ